MSGADSRSSISARISIAFLVLLASVASAQSAGDLVAKGMRDASPGTQIALKAAMVSFRDAIANSPGYAPAYIAAADTQITLASMQWRDANMDIFGLLSKHSLVPEDDSKRLFEEALGWAQKAISLDPSSADGPALAALAYLSEGRTAEAANMANEALAKNKDNPRAVLAGLVILPNDKNTADQLRRHLIELLKQMILSDPNNALLRIRLARHLLALGDNAAAHEQAGAVLQFSPGNADARAIYAETLSWYRNTPWSRIQILSEGIPKSPDDPIVLKHEILFMGTMILLLVNLLISWFGASLRKLAVFVFFLWTLPLYIVVQYYSAPRFSNILQSIPQCAYWFALWGVIWILMYKRQTSKYTSEGGFPGGFLEPFVGSVGNGGAKFFASLELGGLAYFIATVAARLQGMTGGPWFY